MPPSGEWSGTTERENTGNAEFTSEDATVVSEEAFVEHGVIRDDVNVNRVAAHRVDNPMLAAQRFPETQTTEI